jgi:hypothetical protein
MQQNGGSGDGLRPDEESSWWAHESSTGNREKQWEAIIDGAAEVAVCF